jgi:hypothetical protein
MRSSEMSSWSISPAASTLHYYFAMFAILGLICGVSFIWGAIQTWASNYCDLVTFGAGGHVSRLFLIHTTCWSGYGSVPHALTGGWAGLLQVLIGLFLMFLGVGIQVVRS